jgi:hypothetical protein
MTIIRPAGFLGLGEHPAVLTSMPDWALMTIAAVLRPHGAIAWPTKSG